MTRLRTVLLGISVALVAVVALALCAVPTAAEESPILEQAPPLEIPEPVQLTPKEYLWDTYPDEAPLMDRIITCESGWNPNAKSKLSSATGLAQFLSSTWIWSREGLERDPDLQLRLDPYENIDTAIWLLHAYGPTQWECYTLKMI